MEDRIDESLISGSSSIELLDKTSLCRLSNCICKIIGNEGKMGTGFFSKISSIRVLITNYYVIDDNCMKNKKKLKVYIKDDYKIINIDEKSKIYSSMRNIYDIMIIKLKDDKINNYLEIVQNIFKYNSEHSYKDEQIYILHYPNGDKASLLYWIGIEKINEYDIKRLCNTESGSSGGPILSKTTNKVIGIHKGGIPKKKF